MALNIQDDMPITENHPQEGDLRTVAGARGYGALKENGMIADKGESF